MESTFCPRCETELLGTPRVCPACGYDESVDGAPSQPADVTPYTERYRSAAVAASAVMAAKSSSSFLRTRLMVVALLLAVAALYASLMLVTDMRAHSGANGPAPTKVQPDQ